MNKWVQLAIFIIVLQILAFLTSYFVTENAVGSWYQDIVKSPLNPPDWVFAPVWATLYTMIAISGWILWRNRLHPDAKTALVFFIAQLAGNYIWSPVFFGLGAFHAAFWLIIWIDAAILATILATQRASKPAAYLLVPYLLWGLFATHLTYFVAFNN
ncbi:MAG TPA: TspO/MBR family protein [Alphaproteobacteria bacterium]